MLTRFEEVSNAFSDPDADMDKLIAEQAELQEKIDAGNGWDLGRQVEIAMDALRCPPSDAGVDKLSGGEKRRVALCRLLLSKPDMLLLDEPTNHLDAESVAWLERHLAEFPGTVVAVTHDRYFLDNVAGWILELDRGAGIPWEGNYSVLAEAEGQAPRARGEDRRRPPPHHAARARMDGHQPVGAALQEQGAHRRLQPDGRGGASSRRSTSRRSSSRPARGSATT